MSNGQKSVCPICGSEARDSRNNIWTCTSCGMLDFRVGNPDELCPKDKAMLAVFLRERNVSGATQTVILDTVPSDFAEGKAVTLDGVLEIMRGVFSSPMERINRALLSIGRASKGLGQEVIVNNNAMVYAEDDKSGRFILDALEQAGFITGTVTLGGPSRVQLTIVGYNRIAAIQADKRGMDSDQAFVAMWFERSMNEVYEKGIAPAIKGAGYQPMCVKGNVAPGKICEEIIAEIRKSRFLVADFTGHREGVYFEAGFALGLGIPVIWTIRKDSIDDLHFDTRQYRHIDWENADDLRRRLQVSIEANIPKVAEKR